MFQKVMSKSSRDMSKTKKIDNSSLDTCVILYISSSFILCFTSAQCNRHRQHGRYQANMRIHTKRVSACRGPPC